MIICHPLLSTWPPQKQQTTLTLGSKPWKMDLPKEMSVRPVTGSFIIIRSIWAKNLVLFVWIRSDIIGVLKSETWPQFNAKCLFKESRVKQKEHWGSSRLTELYLDCVILNEFLSFLRSQRTHLQNETSRITKFSTYVRVKLFKYLVAFYLESQQMWEITIMEVSKF